MSNCQEIELSSGLYRQITQCFSPLFSWQKLATVGGPSDSIDLYQGKRDKASCLLDNHLNIHRLVKGVLGKESGAIFYANKTAV